MYVRRFNSSIFYAFGALLVMIGALGCAGSRKTSLPPAAQNPEVVALYNEQPITLQEFETQYERSVGSREAAAEDSLGAYQDFLERYVDFKLKVLAARTAGLEDDPGIREEVETYRSQLARPYLMEQEVIEPLLRDLYEKRKIMVDASHILIRLAPDAVPTDTMRAYQRMQALVDSINNGQDFGDIAFRNSEDPSARDPRQGLGYRGSLNFFTGGRMVKAFEDAAFHTPVGEMSPIFRTMFGYHVLQVHGQRPRPQDVRISHIMISPKGQSEEALTAARNRIDSLQTLLAGGASFADLAGEFTDDVGSRDDGGDLGFIAYDGRLITELREAAFALKEVGDISAPIETQYGFHLIQLTDRKEPATFEESYEELKSLASRLPRFDAAQEQYAQQIRLSQGATIDSAAVRRVFSAVPSDSSVAWLSSGRLPAGTLTQPFATLGDSTFSFQNLAAFAASNQPQQHPDPVEVALSTADAFLNQKAIDLEVARLEDRDEEFRTTMAEFKNGLLLFRLMEDSVWSAAASDSAALMALFQEEPEAYRFPERTRLVGLFSSDEELLNTIMTRLEEGQTFGGIYESYFDSLYALRLDTTLVAGTTNSVFDRALDLAEGEHTEPLKYNRSFVILKNDGLEPPRLKTFEEARAEVVNQYQQILEDRLISRLRNQYKVYTFPERLSRAFVTSTGTMEAATSTSATGN